MNMWGWVRIIMHVWAEQMRIKEKNGNRSLDMGVCEKTINLQTARGCKSNFKFKKKKFYY